ncbi:hypothetical protein [Streptomyces sp. NRRL F-5053]|uniref:hypothetical protein n=1 Tax=Streptomyces sp. NRRL F-5053 TaxID=1463854 RepID=UPI0013311FB7|nr:hypothetical protein [Streptomyces sp. NRRL F-5053]
MGFDWEEVLGVRGPRLADAYDEQAANVLHDQPRTAPPGPPADLGDERINLPFEEV